MEWARILGWYRQLVARKFDGSKSRRYPGRPKIDDEIEKPGMTQIARNVTMDEWGFLGNCRHLIHDRDTKDCKSYRDIIESGEVKTLRLPARSPNLNALSERWVKSVKVECLSKLILFGEASLRRVLREYLVHYRRERNHQGKDNMLLFPIAGKATNRGSGAIGCNERLGGLLKYYHLEVA